MTLPGLDLTPLVTAINNNTAMMQNVVDELVRMNEVTQNDVDTQVTDIRATLEQQYRDRIESLEQRLEQKNGHTFPFINGPIRRGVGSAPGPASPK